MTATTATKITAASVVADGDKIIADYLAGDTKIKGSVRAAVTKIKDQAIRDLDIKIARAAQDVLDGCKVTKVAPVVDVDLIKATKIADLEATLRTLYAEASPATAEHLAYGLVGTASTKIAESVTKVTGERAAGRSLQEAFDSMEPGVYTVAQVMKITGLVSSGAISSRLFPKDGGDTTLSGVEPLEVGDEATLDDDTVITMEARGCRVL